VKLVRNLACLEVHEVGVQILVLIYVIIVTFEVAGCGIITLVALGMVAVVCIAKFIIINNLEIRLVLLGPGY